MPRPGGWIHRISAGRNWRLSMLRDYLHPFCELSRPEGELHQSLWAERPRWSARPSQLHEIGHEWTENMHYPDGTCAMPSALSYILIANVFSEVNSISA